MSPSENRAILPEEIRDISAYIRRYREDDGSFDLVVILWSEGDHSDQEREVVAAYAEAGVTWWLEDLTTERFSSLQEVRHRLRMGPPGI